MNRPDRNTNPIPPATSGGILEWVQAVATYVVATLALGYPALAGRFLVTTHSDQYLVGYAFREFTAESLRAGNGFPLWNPFLMGGVPHVAAMAGDIFYPTFLLRMVLPTDVAMTWGFVLHVMLAGVFTYGFLRAAGVGFWGALVGGLAYLMSGPIAGYVSPGHDGKLFVSTLLPLALWFLTIGVRTGKVWTWGALALVVGLAVLSPHPQLLQYMLLTAGSYGLWLALEKDGKEPVIPRKVAFTRLGLALGAVLLGFLIGAIQYVPVAEYVDWSPRAGGAGWEHAVSYSMPIEELVSTYVPQFSGILDAYWGRNGIHFHSEYFGAIALFLAAAGVFWHGRNARRGFPLFWLGVFVVSLLWTLGGFTPFYRLVYVLVPGTKFFRAPSTMMYVTMFSVAVLAALGTDRLLAGRLSRRYIIGWAVGALLVAFLATSGGLTNLAVSVAMPGRGEMAQANHGALMLGAWRSFLFVAAAAAIAWLAAQRKLAPRAAGAALALTLAADYWTVLRHYWQFVPSAAAVYASDPMIETMKREQQPYRVFAIGLGQPLGTGNQVAWRDPFVGGSALMVHHVPNVLGYHGNELGRYQRLVDPQALLLNPSLRELLNVKYLMTDVAPDAPLDLGQGPTTFASLLPGVEHLMGPVQNTAGSTLHLYRFGGQTAPAWVASSIVEAPDDNVLAAVADPRFDATVRGRVALFDTAAVVPARPADAALPEPSPITTTVSRAGPQRLTVRLSAPAAAGNALVVSENYYPGWTARVRGTEVPVYRANYTLIGLALPAGATEIDLTFESAAYEMGKLITLAALAAATLLTLVGAFRSRSAARG